jgi:dTDP-4-dehydrorhamnose reductase
MNKILIFGASGYLGNILYRELAPYFDVYGTYFSNEKFKNNQRFFNYNFETEGPEKILKKVRPNIIICSLRGNFEDQIDFHLYIADYTQEQKCKLIFLSSANVFDVFTNYPSYEFDKTLSESIFGRLKIKIENRVMKLPKKQWIIVRIPMVFGPNSPRIKELKLHIDQKIPFEVFPKLIVNVMSDSMLSRQIHYLINRKKTGIFHLGSKDLIHHDEFFSLLANELTDKPAIFKQVYTTNHDRYLALLQRDNKLPKYLQISNSKVLEDIFLKT